MSGRSEAVIDVAVGLISPQERVLEQAGLPLTLPILLKAMIDSGTARTLIDLSVVAELGLLPTGEARITTPSSGVQEFRAPTYEVKLQLMGPPHVLISPALTVISVDLSRFGLQVLLGRDVLARCLFYYNGPSDQFTFSF